MFFDPSRIYKRRNKFYILKPLPFNPNFYRGMQCTIRNRRNIQNSLTTYYSLAIINNGTCFMHTIV